MTCEAICKTGRPCTNRVAKDNPYCQVHQPTRWTFEQVLDQIKELGQ